MSSNAPGNPYRNPSVLRLPGRGLLLWSILWLALSLLLSQSLGQLHAVKHVIQHGGVVAVAHAAGAHEPHDDHHDYDSDDFLKLLFSSHGSASDCRLYDQLSDGHALPLFFAAPLPIVLPSVLVAIFAGDALARWAALFDARGPPLTS